VGAGKSYVSNDKVWVGEEQRTVKHRDCFSDVKSMCKQIEFFRTSGCVMRSVINFFRNEREMAPLPIAQISSSTRRGIRAFLDVSCWTQPVARVISE